MSNGLDGSDTEKGKAMRGAGRKGFDRIRLGRVLTLLLRACVFGAAVAAVSCASLALEALENADEVVDNLSNSLITVLFFVLLIGWTKWSRELVGRKSGSDDKERHFVMLFGVLITGIFVFMTFRIDRGVENEARRIAQSEMDRIEPRIERQIEREFEIIEPRIERRIERRIAEQIAPKLDGDSLETARRWDAQLPWEFQDPGLETLETLELGLGLFGRSDVPEDARDLSVPSVQEGRLEPGPSVEWFRFRLSDGMSNRYQVVVSGRGGEGLFGFDPAVYLYSIQSGELDYMEYDDDSGIGFGSRLDVELMEGTYYVAVIEITGSAGEFSIGIDLVQ